MKKIIILMLIIFNVLLNNNLQANAESLEEKCKADIFWMTIGCEEYHKNKAVENEKSTNNIKEIKKESLKKEDKNIIKYIDLDITNVLSETSSSEYTKFQSYNYNYDSWLNNYKNWQKASLKWSLYTLNGWESWYMIEGWLDNVYVSNKLGYNTIWLFYKESDLLTKIKPNSSIAEIMNHWTPMVIEWNINDYKDWEKLSTGFNNSKVEWYIKNIKFNWNLCVNRIISDSIKKSNKWGYLPKVFIDCDTNPWVKEDVAYSMEIKNNFLRWNINEDEFEKQISTLYERSIKALEDKTNLHYKKPEKVKFNINTTIFVVTKIIKNDNYIFEFDKYNKKEVLNPKINIKKYKYNKIIHKILKKAEKDDKIIPTILKKIKKIKSSAKFKKLNKKNKLKIETILDYLDEQLIYQQYIYKKTKKFKEMDNLLGWLAFSNSDVFKNLFLEK